MVRERAIREPLRRTGAPECYGNFKYSDCHLCFVVTECMCQTSGKSRRQIIYIWDDLERIKKEIYPELLKKGYIHPTCKLEHLPVIAALKGLLKIS